MAVKYVKEFEFGGSVSHKKPPGMKKDLAPAKPFKGEYQGYAKGGMVKTLDKMMRERRAEMPARAAASVRGMPAEARPMAAARPMAERMETRRPMFKKGGLAYAKGPKAEKKVAKVMREYKKGELHSGKDGPVVKNPKQAMAIALSEARRMKKADGGLAEKKTPKGVDEVDVAVLATKNFQDAAENKYKNDMKLSSLLGLSKPKEYEKRFKETKKRMKDRADEAFYSKHRQMPEDAKKDQRALDKARHAEKYAPGLSLDMADGKMSKFAKGGMAKHEDVKMDKAIVKKAVHKHEKSMHPGKPLTKLKKGGMPTYGRKPMYGGGKC